MRDGKINFDTKEVKEKFKEKQSFLIVSSLCYLNKKLISYWAVPKAQILFF